MFIGIKSCFQNLNYINSFFKIMEHSSYEGFQDFKWYSNIDRIKKISLYTFKGALEKIQPIQLEKYFSNKI